MDKELIDRAWAYLPREFKEEVKRLWSREVDCAAKYKSELHKHRTGLLYELFGENLHWQNNLTSNAEGEEMLMVPRKKVQEFYAKCKEVTKNPYDYPNYSHESALSRMALLDILFGSKCLPDEEYTTCVHASGTACKHYNREEHRCSLRGECKFEPKSVSEISEEISDRVAKTIKTEFDKIEPKPAELKFKFGDKVRTMNVIPKQDIGRVGTVVINKDGLCNVRYNDNSGVWCDESDLEPYTEPKEEADKQFDNILKDSFSKERRLNIATQMVSAYIHCEGMTDPSLIATIAFQLADALIAESEKGGNNA